MNNYVNIENYILPLYKHTVQTFGSFRQHDRALANPVVSRQMS
jgi:hypothetical protein